MVLGKNLKSQYQCIILFFSSLGTRLFIFIFLREIDFTEKLFLREINFTEKNHEKNIFIALLL